MPIGIRPTNDFAFHKVFGSPASKPVLIHLLNAILAPPAPIADLALDNPFNPRDFQGDKLSVLDIKATDSNGAVYNIEMQVNAAPSLPRRLVFYGCELYTGQLRAGQDYGDLRPAISICLLEGVFWGDAPELHHAFRLIDRESGRELEHTLEIHTLEMGKFRLSAAELATATAKQRWIYWLLHAQNHEERDLAGMFPEPAMRQATEALSRIAQVTEDKTMYDAREKARRDRQTELKESFREGKDEGLREGKDEGLREGKDEGLREGKEEGLRESCVENIRLFQDLLHLPQTDQQQLRTLDPDALRRMAADLKKRWRERQGS